MKEMAHVTNLNLVPFNEPQEYTGGTEYASCFYSNLFMFLGAWGEKNISKYIANNIFYYGYKPEEKDLRYKYEVRILSCIDLEKMYEDSGIDVTVHNLDPQNAISCIVQCIRNEIPVMVKVDLFYLSYRPDRFMKVHTNHFVMIYGYDFNRNEIYIFDNPENKEYYKCVMNVDEFIQAFKSAYRLNEDNIFEFKNIGRERNKYNRTDLSKIFLNNIKNNQDLILTGINHIELIAKKFEIITKNQTEWDKNRETLFYLLHYHILNKKKSELYALYYFLKSDHLVVLKQKIVKLWEEIRNVCSYYYLQKRYKADMIKKSIEDFALIKKMELQFYEKIFNG